MGSTRGDKGKLRAIPVKESSKAAKVPTIVPILVPELGCEDAASSMID